MAEGTELQIRKAIRNRYSDLSERGCSCPHSCCLIPTEVPREAFSLRAGCGSPLQLISLKEGDVVLDLGSGGGIDVFAASRLVGENGKAIGVDATPEMVWKARETAQKYNYRNVEFRLGEIELLPIESNSVDYVTSNCVINLSPDKSRVFKEAFRVLKPGGIFAVADITSEKEIPESLRGNLESWAECISGALSISEYKRLLTRAGFTNIEIKPASTECDCNCCNDKMLSFSIASSHIRAKKPY